jgi:hypothetical protein
LTLGTFVKIQEAAVFLGYAGSMRALIALASKLADR